ncbi:MAG: hypothetical protein ACREQD_03315, partial [Candidatus Binataceae bacterium]
MARSHDNTRLRELGLDPAAPPAATLAALRAMRDRPEAPAERIAEALGVKKRRHAFAERDRFARRQHFLV